MSERLIRATVVAQATWVGYEAALRWQTACDFCGRPKAYPNIACADHPTSEGDGSHE